MSIPKETALVFFKLVDRVLTSTHLSSTLLTSFVKRTSRLVLAGVFPRVLLAMIYNCLVRHPTLLVLIQGDESTFDTYNENETDPEVAGGGSLWEVKALMEHWDGRVAGAAKRFGEGLNRAGVRVEGALLAEDAGKREGGWKEAGVREGAWGGIVDSL